MHVLASRNVDFAKKKSYRTAVAYSESKLANILHAFELQRRYGIHGIQAYSLHPGTIFLTELTRDKTFTEALLFNSLRFISKTLNQGAMTILYCALSDEAQPGKYHSNCRVAEPRATAYNSEKAQKLWELSERIINERQNCH